MGEPYTLRDISPFEISIFEENLIKSISKQSSKLYSLPVCLHTYMLSVCEHTTLNNNIYFTLLKDEIPRGIEVEKNDEKMLYLFEAASKPF